MSSFDRILIDPDDRTLNAAMHAGVDVVNRDMAGQGTLPCSGNQAWELICRMNAEPMGSAEWRIPGPGPNAVRAVLVAIWWVDFVGRRHLRLLGGCTHLGMGLPLPLPSPHRPVLACVYPDACVMVTEHRRPRLLCVCDCGAWGPPEKVGWMGPTCGPCHDRSESEALGQPAILDVPGVRQVAYAPDGRLATWAETGEVLLWDAERGVAEQGWTSEGRPPGKIAFSPDGVNLACTSTGQGHTMVLSSDGVGEARERASAFTFTRSLSGSIVLQEGRDGPILRCPIDYPEHRSQQYGWISRRDDLIFAAPFRLSCHDLAVSPDGSLIVAAAGEHGLCFWDIHSGEAIRRVEERDCVGPLIWSPDGTSLVCGVNARHWKAILWDQRHNRRRAVLGGTARLHSMAFTADGRWLITCEERTIRTWDVSNAQERRSLSLPDEEALSIAISPDGRTAALALASGCVRLWPVEMFLSES